MPVYKEEKTNTWRVIYRYIDWKGERKQTSKRGFATRREAQAWEREQLNKVTADVDMTFASFIDHYKPLDVEMSRLLAVRHCAEIVMKGEQKRTNEQQLMP